MRIGFHIPISGGFEQALKRAVQRRCKTLQIFTSAPVQWAHSPLDRRRARWFKRSLHQLDIQPLFVHGAYLLNLASSDDEIRQKSRDNLAEELQRATIFDASGVIIHPGSIDQTGTIQSGLELVAHGIDDVFARADDSDVDLIIENTAGQGNSLGTTPDQIAETINGVSTSDRIKVCIDTAHAFAAGHAVHTPGGLDRFLDRCDTTFGLDRLALIHANDSLAEFGSNVDRHWHIAKGQMGAGGFRTIMNHPRLRELPFIMETPDQDEWYRRDWLAIRRAINADIRPPLPPRDPPLPTPPG